MKICFIVSEIFSFGRYGGFGKLVRDMGTELLKKGVDVYAVTWRGKKQRKVEKVDGITVYSFPYNPLDSITSHLSSYMESLPIYKAIDADIYVSIELQISTYIAQKAEKKKKHVVWFQDPYDEQAYKDMGTVDKNYEWNFKRKMQFYTTIGILRHVCQKVDLFLTQAKTYTPTVKRLYKIHKEISFMPNPVKIYNENIRKSPEPTVCFLGRWDPQKRVELFLKLAKKFPHITFIALGKGHNPKADVKLRKKYRKIKNLQMPGFVTEDEKHQILAKSWILINTSIREGLPISFLEAMAHKTAILSYVNPDKLASKFGYWTRKGDFERGLKRLLKDDLWVRKGEKGFEYVKRFHSINTVVKNFLHNLIEIKD